MTLNVESIVLGALSWSQVAGGSILPKRELVPVVWSSKELDGLDGAISCTTDASFVRSTFYIL